MQQQQQQNDPGKASQQNFKPQWARSGGGFGAARSPAPAPVPPKTNSSNTEGQVHEPLGGVASQMKATRQNSGGGGLAQSGRRAGGPGKQPLARPNPSMMQGAPGGSAPLPGNGSSRGAPVGQTSGRFGLSQDLGPGLAPPPRRVSQPRGGYDQDLGPGLQRKSSGASKTIRHGTGGPIFPERTGPVFQYSIQELLSLGADITGPAPQFDNDFALHFVTEQPQAPVLHTALQTATIFAEWAEQAAQDRDKRTTRRSSRLGDDDNGTQGNQYQQGNFRRQSSNSGGGGGPPGWSGAGGTGPSGTSELGPGERDRFGNMMRGRDAAESRGWTNEGRRGPEPATGGARRSSTRTSATDRWERGQKPITTPADGIPTGGNLAGSPPMREGNIGSQQQGSPPSGNRNSLGLDAISAAAQDFEALMRAERQARSGGAPIGEPASKPREEYIPGQMQGFMGEPSMSSNPILNEALEEGTNQPPAESAMSGFVPHDWSTNTFPPAHSSGLPGRPVQPVANPGGGAWGATNNVMNPAGSNEHWNQPNAPAGRQFNNQPFPVQQNNNMHDSQYGVQQHGVPHGGGQAGGLPPVMPVQQQPTEWFYLDPKGNIQGPFQSKDMREWYKLGFFKGHLPIRRGRESQFVQLANMFAEGEVPFGDGSTAMPQLPQGQVDPHQQQFIAPASKDPRLMAPPVPVQQQQPPAPAAQQQANQTQTNAWNQGQPQAGQVSEQGRVSEQRTENPAVDAQEEQSRMEAEAAARESIKAAEEAKAREAAHKEAEAAKAAEAQRKKSSKPAKETPKKNAPGGKSKQSPPKKPETGSAWVQPKAPAQTSTKSMSEIQSEEVQAKKNTAKEQAAPIAAVDSSTEDHASRVPQAPAWGGVAKAKVQSALTLKEIQEQEEADRLRALKNGTAAAPTSSMSMAARIAAAAGISRSGTAAAAASAAAPSPAAVVQTPSVPISAPSADSSDSGAWSTVGKKSKSIVEIQEEEDRQRQAEAAAQGSLWNHVDGSGRSSGGWASKVGSQPARAPSAGTSATGGSRGYVQSTRQAAAATAPVARSAAVKQQQSSMNSTSSVADTSSNAFGKTMSPSFRKWAEEQGSKVGADIALAEFCYTLDSAADIREYLREYLGSTPSVSAFATEFIKQKMALGGGNSAQGNDGGFAEVTRRGKKKG